MSTIPSFIFGPYLPIRGIEPIIAPNKPANFNPVQEKTPFKTPARTPFNAGKIAGQRNLIAKAPIPSLNKVP